MYEVKNKDPILAGFLQFMQTADAVQKYTDAVLFRKAGLSGIKFFVLQLLSVNGGTMGPSKIAEATLRERHDITTLVDRMQRDGLVTTERSTRDRRFKNVTITEEGRRLHKEVMPVARETVDQVMSSLSEEDAVLLKKLLEVLRQNSYRELEKSAKRSKRQTG